MKKSKGGKSPSASHRRSRSKSKASAKKIKRPMKRTKRKSKSNLKKKWVGKAFSKNPGKLHRRLGIPEGQKIPQSVLDRAANSKDASLAREANLAKRAQTFKH